MANCANCERELAEDERGFCTNCSTRFGTMSTDTPSNSRGGIGGALGGILGAVGGRAIGIGVAIGISALIGVLCVADQGEDIEDQNRAAQQGSAAGDGDRTGEKSVFDLRAGDCFAGFRNSSVEQDTVDLVTCTDSRAQLRVTDLALVSTPSDDYPGDAYFDEQAALLCKSEATSYISPSQESWDAGDRTLTCLAET